MKKYLLTILFSFAFLSGFGQKDNYGTEFWTGFLGNIYAYKGDTNRLQLYIAAKQNTNVTISIPLVGFSKTIFVDKNFVSIFTLPIKLAFIDASEKIEKKGIYIVSDYPIAVSAMNLLNYTTDASVVYPLKSLIPRAKFTAVHPEVKDLKDPKQTGLSEILLVGTDDGTKVEITPTAKTVGGKQAFAPFDITLNRGETYMVTSFDNLDGTSVIVKNKKRLAVYVGNRCSDFPCGACDHQVEQLLSNELLDTVYFALPQFGSDSGYMIKVVSIDSALWIKVNGVDHLVPAKDSGLIFDARNSWTVLRVSSDRKFSCFQFLKGMNCNGYTLNPNYSPGNAWGDPSTVQLMSHAFFTKNSVFSTVTSNNLQAHYVTLLVPTNGTNQVYIDGVKVPPNKFIKVKVDPQFSYAMMELTFGTHSIRADSGHIAYSYGLGLTESYLYLAAYSLPIYELVVFDSVMSYDCKNSLVTMQFEAQRIGAVDYFWNFGDGNTDTNRIVTHVYKAPGVYTLKAKTVAFNGKIDSFSKTYNIAWPDFNPVYDKILCDSNFVFNEPNTFFTNFVWHDKSKNNFYKATKDENIWVTATDTSGYCKFKDSAKIVKAGTNAKLFVDTISHCYADNLFRFNDSLAFRNDLVSYRMLRYNGIAKAFKNNNFDFHFNKTGKFDAYLDVYPARSSCIYTYKIPINILPSAKVKFGMDKDKYCHGETVTLTDSTTFCCGTIKKYYALFNDTVLYQSTGNIKGKAIFDFKNSSVSQKIKYFTEASNGCFDTMRSYLQVFPPAPTVFDLGADSIKCLSLARWTFTHTINTNLSGNYTLLWDFGNGTTGTQSQYKNLRYADTGIYKVKLTTTTTLGCIDSSVKHVYVMEQPVPHFTVSDSVQCLDGNAFSFVDQSGGKFLNYLWKFGDGKSSTLKNPQHSYDSAGKYRVNLIINAKYPGCFDDSIKHSAEVLRPPKALFSFNKDTQCLKANNFAPIDQSVFYQARSKYYWLSNQQTDSSQIPTAIRFASTGSNDIRLILVDAMGCRDTFIKNVSVWPEPVVDFTINDTIQCFGTNQFDFNQSPVDPNIKTLLWELDNTVLAKDISQTSLSNMLQVGVHHLALSGTTAFGCTDKMVKSFEVLPKPVADFTVNKDTQCFNDQHYNFTNTSNALKDKIISYIYQNNALTIGSTADMIDHKFTSTGAKSVYLQIVTQESCRDSITHQVFVAENPQAHFDNDSVCLGQTITLSAMQTKGNLPVNQWLWDMQDGTTYTMNPISHIYNGQGIYVPTLMVSDRLGCVGNSQGTVLVYSLPQPTFKIDILNSDKQFTYVKLLPDNSGYAAYLWSFPDGSQNATVSPLINFKRFFKDYIRLKVTDIHGCEDTVSQYMFIYPPIDELYFENAFTPNNDQLNDVFKPSAIEGAFDYKLRIFNRWGEMVFSSNNHVAGWDGTYLGKNAEVGVYMFTVEFKYADGNRYESKGNVTLVR